MTMLTIFTDGGSRGNPGPAASGFVISQGEKVLIKNGVRLGVATNNVAEYSAILFSLEWVVANREKIGKISGINFFMDSQLAARQLNGQYRITKPHLVSLLRKIQELVAYLTVPITYTHVPREENKEADAMVNAALDNIL